MDHAFTIKLVAALLVAALPQCVAAASLPASVTACSAVTDVLLRLACYDREVARYTRQPPPVVTPGEAANAGSQPNEVAAPIAATAAAALSAAEPRRVSARIIGIEGHGDALLVRLDNGQLWQQVQKAEATLGLRTGDRVTIDKGLGNSTYWLAGPSQAVMQVERLH